MIGMSSKMSLNVFKFQFPHLSNVLLKKKKIKIKKNKNKKKKNVLLSLIPWEMCCFTH